MLRGQKLIPRRARQPRRLRVEPLEPRCLLSASPTVVGKPPQLTPPAFLPGPSDYAPAAVVSGAIHSSPGGPVLVLRGTDQADSITLSQSGRTIVVTVGGGQAALRFAAPGGRALAGIVVYGFAGDDTLQETSPLSASLVSVIYAGAGNDTIYANAPGKAFVYGQDDNDQIVAVGGGADVLSGGSGLDSFWFNATDALTDAGPAETAARTIHSIALFVRPVSHSARSVSASTIVQPAAGYPYTNHFASRPLFAGTPQYNDPIQGALSDCYFVAALSSLAQAEPQAIQQAITALGDGTYAVRFFRNGQDYYVRVDAKLPTNGDHPVYERLTRNGGALWAALLEKAYALFRSGQNSYSSLNYGYMSEVYQAIAGVSSVSYDTGSMKPEALATRMAADLSAGRAVAALSLGQNVPIIANHAYEIHSVEQDAASGAWYVAVYNPWGIDGLAWDSNGDDGLLQLTAADFRARFGTVQTALG